jgi:Tol biopolymer transport system component
MTFVVVAALALSLQEAAGAQAPRALEAQFKAAEYREHVRGDLEGAIDDYRKLARSGDREVAARALLGIGRAYQKLGSAEARVYLDRVVKEYPEQREVVAAARRRLAAFDRPAARDASMPRRLMSTETFIATSITPDGRLAAGTSPGAVQGAVDLMVRDLAGEQMTRLYTAPPEERIWGAVISPDGRLVAFESTDSAAKTIAAKVVSSTADAPPRALLSGSTDTSWVRPLAWTRDSEHVVVIRGRNATGYELHAVAVADGATRLIARGRPGAPPQQVSVSPDGTCLAFMVPNTDQTTQVRVLDLSNGAERTVVHTAAGNRNPVWTPDGAHILYVSDRAGANALWSVRAAGGPGAEPLPVLPDFDGLPLAVSAEGVLFYSKRPGRAWQTMVAQKTSPGSAAVTHVLPGFNPTISPDGQSVASFTGPTAGQGPSVVIRALETGAERRYRPVGLDTTFPPRWTPDGSAVIVHVDAAGDGGNQGGALIALDTKGPQRRLFSRDTATHVRANAAAVSPDGGTLYMVTRMKEPGEAPSGPRRWIGIAALDIATGAEAPIAAFPGEGVSGIVDGMELSPDGRTLALLTRLGGGGGARLFLVGTDGSNLRQLGDRIANGGPSLAWTPDGRSIVISDIDERKVSRTIRIPISGGAPTPDGVDYTRLAGSVPIPSIQPGSGTGVSYSRDGLRLVFGAVAKPTHEVWALELPAVK